MRVPAIFAALLSVAILVQPAHAEHLNLVCRGNGEASRSSTSSVSSRDADGNVTTGTVSTPYSVGFSDQVKLEVDGIAGKIRVPRSMLPVFHGGAGGLFDLKNVLVTDRDVTASIAINAVQHPKLRLDRVTGNITIDGKVGHFNGECQPYDPEVVQRRF